MARTSPERWRQVEALLDAVLDLPPEAWEAFVESHEPADPAVRPEVLRLLAAHGRAERFLERPAAEVAASLLATPGEEDDGGGQPHPERVGPYRLLCTAGEGGMGTVFLAERDDPQLRQRVALKLVRSGPTHDSLVRRFLDERQILASLDHPGIARLFDGGVMEDGVPWFAMEYVEGVPLDRFCADRDLGVADRLRLFLQVCEAVQYAHRNLVVHRDLKPSNILVARSRTAAADLGAAAALLADTRVKLIDFGIAKILAGGDIGTGGEPTRGRLRPLTPGYASPEQIRGERVSTSSDVYALGIVLYELLTGRHPFATPDCPPHEIARAILEDEPARPSTIAPPECRRALRGDLETIVLMAMRKEPERRYASVDQLATDIRRYLGGRPVTARRATWGYRTGRFVRRHPGETVATTAFAMVAAAFALTITAHAERAGVHRNIAAIEAARTDQIRSFLLNLFSQADPGRSGGRDPTASDLIAIGALAVEAELAGQPDLQAEMRRSLGEAYLALGRYEAAAEQLRAALAIRRRIDASESEELVRVVERLGESLHYAGQLDEAELMLRDAVGMRCALHGESDRRVGLVLTDLGDLLHTRGELAAAEQHLRDALRILVPVLGEDHSDVARAQRDLGNVLRDRGAHAEAEMLYRSAYEALQERLGAGDPITALTRNELARLLAETGAHEEADWLLHQNLAVYRSLYPGEHPMLGTTLRNLGVLRLREGRPDEAVAALTEALAIYQRTLPATTPLIPRARRHLARALLEAGDTTAAADLAEAAIAGMVGLGLSDHRATGDARRLLERSRATQLAPAH